MQGEAGAPERGLIKSRPALTQRRVRPGLGISRSCDRAL
jgi:hypothetical protein